MKVKYNQISIKNFRIGDIVEGSDDNQYTITDAVRGKAELEQLSKQEIVKKEFLLGRVTL